MRFLNVSPLNTACDKYFLRLFCCCDYFLHTICHCISLCTHNVRVALLEIKCLNVGPLRQFFLFSNFYERFINSKGTKRSLCDYFDLTLFSSIIVAILRTESSSSFINIFSAVRGRLRFTASFFRRSISLSVTILAKTLGGVYPQ